MKKYLITGASSGIGKRCAERLLNADNECILISRSGEKMREIFLSYQEKAHIITADFLDIGSIENIFITSRSLFPLDGMIHCAGIAQLKRADENTMDSVRAAYTTNVFSFIELMRNFVQNGVCKEGASVVAIPSVVAHRGSNRQSIYSGTKAALEATVRCMAKELINQIRVNAVVSGTVETEMLQKLRLESQNLDEKIKQHTPLGIVPIDEVCEMIEFLLSESANHITGASMPIDGGYLL